MHTLVGGGGKMVAAAERIATMHEHEGVEEEADVVIPYRGVLSSSTMSANGLPCPPPASTGQHSIHACLQESPSLHL